VSNKEVPLSLGKMLFSFHSTHPMCCGLCNRGIRTCVGLF